MKLIREASLLVFFAFVPVVLAGMRAGKRRKVPKKKFGEKKPKGRGRSYDQTCSTGLVQVQSRRSFDDTYNMLLLLLKNTTDVYIAADFDAVKVAKMAGVEGLPPNRVLVFGNPGLATPLIQADQSAALDLPQKMHVYQTMEGKVFVGYNAPEFVDSRYGGIDESTSGDTLKTIGTALRSLAANVAGVDPTTVSHNVFPAQKKKYHRPSRAGIYVRQSNADFNTTYTRLMKAFPENDFVIVATVDHKEMASSKDLTIAGPTRLIMFCFPQFDATFMQANQCAVADFPLKMLVTEDADGNVEVRINSFQYLRKRHHIGSGSISEVVYDKVYKAVVDIMDSAIA